MLKANAEKKRKIKYNDRMEVEILFDTKHYKAGQIIAPHRVVAEQLVKEKIAKVVK